jgi:fatty acid desaturase
MQTNQQYQLYTDYFRELRERIIAKKLHTPSPVFGSIALLVSISLFLGGIVFMSNFHPVIVGIYFYILLVELGYISHDLIHGQYFKKAAHNKFFSYITANLLT